MYHYQSMRQKHIYIWHSFINKHLTYKHRSKCSVLLTQNPPPPVWKCTLWKSIFVAVLGLCSHGKSNFLKIFYSETCLKRPLSKRPKKMIFNTIYRLMQVKSIAEHSSILSTCIKLPFVIKIFVFSSFEWPLKTGFTVFDICNPWRSCSVLSTFWTAPL